MLRFDQVEIEQGSFRLSADFSISAGETVAIIGASGAGKSTLLAALGGYLPLTSGQITWHDRPLSPSVSERPISMIFQDNNLFPHLTAAQNVGLGISGSLKLARNEQERVESALERVGLAGLSSRKPEALSGGQMARVALARSLVMARPLLLLDEPFGALGPALKRDMLGLVKELVAETDATLLMVSHDPKDALEICEQTVFIAQAIAQAPVLTQQIFDNPPQELQEYLGSC